MSRYRLMLVRVHDGSFCGRRIERIIDYDYLTQIPSGSQLDERVTDLICSVLRAQQDEHEPATATVAR